MGRFTDDEKRREALREAAMRRNVYAKRGMVGQIDRDRIAIMDEIAADYAELVARDGPHGATKREDGERR